MLAAVVLHGQRHVIIVDIWVFSDEIDINLLLLSVLKHFLSESLEILSQIFVFLQ